MPPAYGAEVGASARHRSGNVQSADSALWFVSFPTPRSWRIRRWLGPSGSRHHGLFRLFGADATTFPNHGGRFGSTRWRSVHKARDTKLDCDGALKVLPEAFTSA